MERWVLNIIVILFNFHMFRVIPKPVILIFLRVSIAIPVEWSLQWGNVLTGRATHSRNTLQDTCAV